MKSSITICSLFVCLTACSKEPDCIYYAYPPKQCAITNQTNDTLTLQVYSRDVLRQASLLIPPHDTSSVRLSYATFDGTDCSYGIATHDSLLYIPHTAKYIFPQITIASPDGNFINDTHVITLDHQLLSLINAQFPRIVIDRDEVENYSSVDITIKFHGRQIYIPADTVIPLPEQRFLHIPSVDISPDFSFTAIIDHSTYLVPAANFDYFPCEIKPDGDESATRRYVLFYDWPDFIAGHSSTQGTNSQP